MSSPSTRRLRALASQLLAGGASGPLSVEHVAAVSEGEGSAGSGEFPEYMRLSQLPAGPAFPRDYLTDEEKRLFFRDGVRARTLAELPRADSRCANSSSSCAEPSRRS